MKSKLILLIFGLCALLIPSSSALAQYYPYYSAPNPQTGSANASYNSVSLYGTVNPNGSYTTAWFEYGTYSGSLNQRSYTEQIGSDNTQRNVNISIYNLQPNTSYSYRLVAQNQYGTQYGTIQTFQTGYNTGIVNPINPINPITNRPQIELQNYTDLARGSVTLHSKVTSNGLDTTVWYEYGTTNSLGTDSPNKLLSSQTQVTQVNYYLSGLRAGTKYYYRVNAQNSLGLTQSEIQNFTTTGSPAPEPTPTPTPTNPTSTPSSTPVVPPANGSILTLVARLDNSQPKPKQEFNLILEYHNTKEVADQSILTVILPPEADFVIADRIPNLNGTTLTFNLGSISGSANETLRVRLRLKEDASAGKNLVFGATLAYKNARNEQRTAVANASMLVGTGEAPQPGDATSTGGVSLNLGGLPWYGWIILFVFVVIGLAAAYIFYRYGKSRSRLSQ